MSNLYFYNLPGIYVKNQADAIYISTKKSIKPFLDYYYNYIKEEKQKIIEINLELKDWDEFFEKNDFDKKEKELEDKKKDDLDKEPRELVEIRKLRDLYRQDFGLYELSLTNDKLDDNKVISDLANYSKVSLNNNLRSKKEINIEYISKRFDIIVMKKQYEKDNENKKLLEELTVYYKPNVKQINLIINTLNKLSNTPAIHNRALIRLFENKDKVNFESFNIINNIRDDEWLFLTDTSRTGNDSQREFVKIAMSTPDFAILDGPPGSGKTTTILELIYQLVKRKKKILLVGSTHVAVDNVIEKLMDPDFPEREKLDNLFMPIRIGDPNKHPISDFAADYTLGSIWETKKIEQLRYFRSLDKKTESQIEFQKLLEDKNKSKLIKYSILKTNALTCGTTVGITNHQLIIESNSNKKNDKLFDYLILDEASKTTFQEFLIPGIYAEKFIIIGDVKQLSPFVDENGLSSNITNLGDFTEEKRYWKTVLSNFNHIQGRGNHRHRALIICDNDEMEVASKILEKENYIVKSLDTDSTSEILIADIILTTNSNLSDSYDNLPLTISFALDARKNKETERYAIFRNIEKLDENIISKNYKYRHEFIRHNGFIPERQNSYQDDNWENALSWRLIRINEVSEINNNYRKNLEEDIKKLLPDDEDNRDKIENEFYKMYQITLPSILQLLQIGLKVPLFKPREDVETTLSNGMAEEFLKNRYVKLKYQHRMHPQISKFARENFYQNEALIDSNRLDRKLPNYNLYRDRIIWIDVVNKDQKDITVNQNEINQILYELDRLFDYLKTQIQRNWTIAILTFYKKQRKELFNVFNKNKHYKKIKSRTYRRDKFDNVTIRIDVVDSFQGHEADFVFISMVRNKGIGFMDNPNRLNVALTRAKYQLVIVGNKKHFQKQKRSTYLNELTRITTERGINYEN